MQHRVAKIRQYWNSSESATIAVTNQLAVKEGRGLPDAGGQMELLAEFARRQNRGCASALETLAAI